MFCHPPPPSRPPISGPGAIRYRPHMRSLAIAFQYRIRTEEIVPLRKVCRRPETDYRLQELRTGGNTVRAYPPVQTPQTQPNAAAGTTTDAETTQMEAAIADTGGSIAPVSNDSSSSPVQN